MPKRILVVEDEPGVQELLQLNLKMSGYSVGQSPNVDEALRWLYSNTPDLVLVDWNMPGRSGVSLVRYLRTHSTLKSVPIIMLTARDDEMDKVLAFESGADDYVTKPFKIRELLARVQSLLRRSDGHFDTHVIRIDGLTVNEAEKRVCAGDRELDLSATEYKLLLLLVRRPMVIYSRAQLIEQVWGNGVDLQPRSVDVYMARLRGQLEAAGHHDCIETVRSMGYRFLKREDLVHLEKITHA